MSASQVIIAFAELYGSRKSFVSICKHGGKPGYVHIVPAGFDPTKVKHRHVAVELYNGTVCVTNRLKAALGARPRPHGVRIEADPIGYSAGPSYGRFEWALTFSEIEARKGALQGFVKDIARSLEEDGEAGGEPGDYDAD